MKLLTLGWILLIFVSCQVKEPKGSAGLISGHVPVSNSFKLQTPASKTFITGETLSLVLTFPFNVTVTGTPRLTLTIGATTAFADYISGDGSTILTFQYTVIASDNDTDGITVNNLDLNGATMTFDLNGVITNCNVASLSEKTLSNVKVDNAIPSVTAMVQTNLPGFYHKDETLNFTVTFNEPVIVTGTPRILMDFATGPAVYANYSGGSGSSTLAFSLLIDNTIAETNQYDSIAGSIDPNGGTIKDSVGNAANLDISAYTGNVRTNGATRPFDGRVPYIISLTPPANGTYASAQALALNVEFDRAVNVTGSPYISLTIGGTPRQAAYVSSSVDKKILTFSYTTVPGDVDTDGITVATTITANGGTISGAAAPVGGNFLITPNNLLTVPPTTGILVNSVQPQPIVATRNIDSTNRIWGGGSDDTWIIDQDLLISVTFNTNMYVVQTIGTPRIPIVVGATTRYAEYLSGGNGQTALVFRYVIQEGDLDTDGAIAIGSIDLNGGKITDVANTNTLLTIPTTSLTSTKIDGVRPVVSNLGVTDGTYSTYVNTMNFTVTWSEAVNYSTAAMNVPLTIGASAVNAPYVSGSNTNTIIHRPNITAGMNDSDGVAMATALSGTAIIRDQAGNTATDFSISPPVMAGVLVDTTPPAILSVNPPAPGVYKTGNDLNFTVTFNEVVNVNSDGTYPRIALAFDTGTKYATYVSGSGSTNILFRYTVVSGDSDLLGIPDPTQITLGGSGYLQDIAQNTAAPYSMTTSLAGVVVDGLAPSISARTFPANGTYESGDVLQFTTTFSEVVKVTGTPRIQVTAQTGTLNFDYIDGTDTNTLTFEYTVTADDFDFDGLPTAVNAISLNGGTIQDAQSNNATLTFTAANLSSIFIAYPNTVIWSTSTFANKSAIPGLNVSNGGTASLQACGTSTCQTMNGNGSFNISGDITGVEEIFIVFKTPGLLANQDLFGNDVSLVDDSATFDLSTANATLTLNGSPFSGVNHDTNLGLGSTNILHAIFSANQSYTSGALIPSTFGGAIGEVIVVTSPLTAAQRSAILNYLNTKY